jgi:hypothetical protein
MSWRNATAARQTALVGSDTLFVSRMVIAIAALGCEVWLLVRQGVAGSENLLARGYLFSGVANNST